MSNTKGSLTNFGKAGWGTILYCLFMFFFYVGMINDGTNVSPCSGRKHRRRARHHHPVERLCRHDCGHRFLSS